MCLCAPSDAAISRLCDGPPPNHLGERADQRPVHFQEIFATLYHNLGIDSWATTIRDPAGRPQHLVEQYQSIRELI